MTSTPQNPNDDLAEFREAIARAFREDGGEDPVEMAEEALITDNEALALAESDRR